MLRTSTRNVAYEVISCLIDSAGKGVLTEIIKFLTISNKHIIEVEENSSSILDTLTKKQVSTSKKHPHNANFVNQTNARGIPARNFKQLGIEESEEDTESYSQMIPSANVIASAKKAVGTSSSSKKEDFKVAENQTKIVNKSSLGGAAAQSGSTSQTSGAT